MRENLYVIHENLNIIYEALLFLMMYRYFSMNKNLVYQRIRLLL